MTSDGRRGRGNPKRGGRDPKAQAGSASGLGPALELTPEQLDQVAEISPADVATAKALWRENAPKQLADLLDAEAQ